ncbi:MAG: hypothetical protein ACREXY_06250 [Gammaproteobacteria bacterium]
MATKEHTAAVEIRDTTWVRTFFGTGEALIAAGHVRLEWLPGQPGRGKTRQSVILEADGTADLSRIQGASIEGRANGRPWIAITRKSASSFEVVRPYRPDEMHITQRVNDEQERARQWLPKATTPYGRELELCHSARDLHWSQVQARNKAKMDLEMESAAKFRDDVEEESGEDFDRALFAFALFKYADIMQRLKHGNDDDDDRRGGRKTPDPEPSPSPAAA